MREPDVEAVSTMLQTSFPTIMNAYLPLAQHGCASYLRAGLAFPSEALPRVSFVAAADDQVLGYAEFTRGQGGTAYLSYVCVAETVRGRGVGRALLRHGVENLAIKKLDLDVFDDNESALRMYERLGFRAQPGARFWVRRVMPGPGDAVANLLQPHVAIAAHSAYGFSQLDVEVKGKPMSVGLIGASVVRIPDAATLRDTAALSVLRRLLPDRTQAISIVDSDEGFDDVIVRSLRMSATRETILESSGGST